MNLNRRNLRVIHNWPDLQKPPVTMPRPAAWARDWRDALILLALCGAALWLLWGGWHLIATLLHDWHVRLVP